MSRFVLLVVSLLALLSSPVFGVVRVPALPRSSTWAQLQSELQSEFDAGLDEAELASLEQSVVSREGAQCLLQQPRQCDTSAAVRVHLDIAIDAGTVGSRAQIGRVTLDLFNSTAPRTVANFLTICSGSKRGFTFRNNKFHRVITGSALESWTDMQRRGERAW
jgi:hypothetical protein